MKLFYFIIEWTFDIREFLQDSQNDNDVLIYKPAGQGTNLVAGQYIYIYYVVCDFNPWKLIVHMF